jgi:hypothetical protein
LESIELISDVGRFDIGVAQKTRERGGNQDKRTSQKSMKSEIRSTKEIPISEHQEKGVGKIGMNGVDP